MWWNKSNDASLAVAFVAAYAIRLYVVYSAFGLSENLEQLVYPFSFLLKKKSKCPLRQWTRESVTPVVVLKWKESSAQFSTSCSH